MNMLYISYEIETPRLRVCFLEPRRRARVFVGVVPSRGLCRSILSLAVDRRVLFKVAIDEAAPEVPPRLNASLPEV